MARSAGARPRQACHVAGALDARRQGLRLQLGNAHDGHRTLCAVDRAALCHRNETARAEPNASGVGYIEVPASRADRRPAFAAFVTAAVEEIRKLTGKRFGLMGLVA